MAARPSSGEWFLFQPLFHPFIDNNKDETELQKLRDFLTGEGYNWTCILKDRTRRGGWKVSLVNDKKAQSLSHSAATTQHPYGYHLIEIDKDNHLCVYLSAPPLEYELRQDPKFILEAAAEVAN